MNRPPKRIRLTTRVPLRSMNGNVPILMHRRAVLTPAEARPAPGHSIGNVSIVQSTNTDPPLNNGSSLRLVEHQRNLDSLLERLHQVRQVKY